MRTFLVHNMTYEMFEHQYDKVANLCDLYVHTNPPFNERLRKYLTAISLANPEHETSYMAEKFGHI